MAWFVTKETNVNPDTSTSAVSIGLSVTIRMSPHVLPARFDPARPK